MMTDWRYFEIGKLFSQIYKALAYNAQDLIKFSAVSDDAIRYITRTATNNGCREFVQNENFTQIEQGNAITIGDTTATIYYQSEQFICGDHIVILRAPFLNEMRGVFIVTLLNKERFRYNYGRSFKMDIIKKTRILLPSSDGNKPDWNYIDSIVKQNIIPTLPSKSREVWENKYKIKPLYDTKACLNTKDWQWFNVGSLFKVKKCKCSNATEMLVDGDEIAYIGAKKSENGVIRYVKRNEDLVTKGNCIVFIGDGQGSVGYCLYQPNDFIGSTTLIAGYVKGLNPYIAQFLVTVLDMERYRYSFGRKYNKNAITNSRIKLPIDSKGNPDWQFMENYIKSLPYSANL
ncbi:MAG: restriction endonuclease subunit S [Muribaculaceae bacterium]